VIEKPQIVKTATQLAAVIQLVVPREEIRNVMEPGLKEIMTAIAAQGIAPSGPWFTHHHRMDPAVFDFEIGVPVARAVSPAGRVVPGQLPAATVARTVYHGPYEGLGDGWGEFQAWMAAEGHVPASDLWERYVVVPESSSDPSAWRTELSQPLAKVGG
jgi:effector-binding domain-containing protein